MNITQNEWYTDYTTIIDLAKKENRVKNSVCYYERHHIVPKACEGLDTKENIVLLTPEEHYTCHMLLPKFLSGEEKKKMLYAWNRINSATTSGRGVDGEELIGMEEYSRLRREFSESISGENNPMYGLGENHPRNGVPLTENHRENLSKNHADFSGENNPFFGKKHDEETLERMLIIKKEFYANGGTAGMTGKRHTAESREKMSIKLKGENSPNYGKINIHHPISNTSKRILPEDFSDYEKQGWVKGMRKRKKKNESN